MMSQQNDSSGLGEVRQMLLRVADRLSTMQKDQEVSQPSSLSSSAAGSQARPGTSSGSQAGLATSAGLQARQVSAAMEQRRLFGFGKKKSSKGKNAVKTCTLKFVCLASKDDEGPPSSVKQRTDLSNAGLGDANISFVLDGSTAYNGILEKFPKLKYVGGFDLLLFQRGGGEDGGFHRIMPPHTPDHLKELCGQSKIYIRPVQEDIKVDDNIDDIFEPPAKKFASDIPAVECFTCGKNIPMTEMYDHKASCCQEKPQVKSSFKADGDHKDKKNKGGAMKPDSPKPGRSCDNDEPTSSKHLNQLKEIFPDTNDSILEIALSVHTTVEKAAIALSGGSTTIYDSDSDIEESAFGSKKSLKSVLERLKKNLSNEREKLKVDEDDLLNDAMSYYKDAEFDPRKKLRVVMNNQPAADTGGVTRQFFTQLIKLLTDELFSGDKYKSPIYNPKLVATGMMKLFGKIIVHSILQGGPGIPILSPPIFYYIATGDSEKAIERVTINECSLRIQNYIQKVASAVDISDIDQEETLDILSECGLTVSLTNDNKMEVIRSVIVHGAIGKPKIILDQLRDGLSILGFGDEMKKDPELMKPLFVPGEIQLKGTDVIEILCFPSCEGEDEARTKEYLKQYILEASPEVLENFLVFSTGSPTLPSFGLGTIKVKFEAETSVFASTCLQEITIPKGFPDKETFVTALDAVINTLSKSFNCI